MTAPPNVLPRWLEGNPPVEALRADARHRRRRGALDKTLHDVAEAFKNEVFSEHLARQPGLLQGVDPRVKLLTVLLLIGAAAVLSHVTLLMLLNAWLLWLARSSRVPLRFFVKRVWVVVLLFTGVVVFPAIFNIVRPGTPLLVLVRLSHPVHLWPLTIPQEVAVTRQGLEAAALLVLRVGASISLAVLLTLTTRWPVLLKALGVLRIPGVFITVLEMTYRYVFLLLQASADTFTARRSRTVGRTSTAEQRTFTTHAMGNLWARTHATSEEVHHAMLSRGYTGEPLALAQFRLRRSDALWGVIVLLVIALLIGGNHVLG
jgi:cobalt/nickel transport system permease protein